MKSRLILAECLIRPDGGVVLGQSYYLEQPTISNHGLDCATLLAKEKSGKKRVVCNAIEMPIAKKI